MAWMTEEKLPGLDDLDEEDKIVKDGTEVSS